MAVIDVGVSSVVVAEMREWIADCWPSDETGVLTDAAVVAGVARHYEGGVAGFVTDGLVVDEFAGAVSSDAAFVALGVLWVQSQYGVA